MWKIVYKQNKGHRLFADSGSGRLAIADDSGRYPDTTDDGTLWVDTGRDMTIDDGHLILPLIVDRTGEGSATLIGYGLAACITKLTAMRITMTIDGEEYVLCREPASGPRPMTDMAKTVNFVQDACNMAAVARELAGIHSQLRRRLGGNDRADDHPFTSALVNKLLYMTRPTTTRDWEEIERIAKTDPSGIDALEDSILEQTCPSTST